jgi:hypothetical protein
MTCEKCETNCLNCEPKLHVIIDDQPKAEVKMPVILALKILEEGNLSENTKRELIDCIQNA